MIEETLSKMLKKYVDIFINEYKNFLSSSQLDLLKSIDYQKIITIENLSKPFGEIFLGKIYLSKANEELIERLHKMEGFNTHKYNLDNKDLSSYLKYMCENGYDIQNFYQDILIYFVFKMIIKDSSSFLNGIINQEVKYLSIKYSIKCANLYPKEEKIVEKVTKILKLDVIRKLLFMDKVSRFKYLCDNYGYRYGVFFEKIENIMKKEFNALDKPYDGVDGFLDYTDSYDQISYGEAYNGIIEFQVENKLR